MKCLYKKYAKYYDLIYAKKNYAKETKFLEQLIKKHKITGKDILEVGCGTGSHAMFLKKKGFKVTGIDLGKEMIAVAKKKDPSGDWRVGNMQRFRLSEQYDIVICLFSVMHYNLGYPALKKTLANFHTHLKRGGLLIFDMGFNEERFDPKGRVFIDVRKGKEFGLNADLVRYNRSRKQGSKCLIDMGYMIYKNNKFEFASEQHQLYIFETIKVKKLAEQLGFQVDIYHKYLMEKWKKTSKGYAVFAALKK